MQYNEHAPKCGWKKHYRNLAIKEAAQQIALLIGCAILYLFGGSL